MKIKITNIINEPTDYILSKNMYAIKHISLVELKQSTSADGWKYHKHNKKVKQRNKKMKDYKILFCDLDGTLIKTKSGETFPKGIWDMEFRFDVLDAIKKLNPDYILIVSNQGGIESGFVDAQNFRAKSEYVARAVVEYCNCKCYAMYCKTNDKSDPYRKPNVGMLEGLLESYVGDDFDYIKQKSLMIGDASGKEGQFSDSDKKTAENFGIDYMDVDDFVRYWED